MPLSAVPVESVFVSHLASLSPAETCELSKWGHIELSNSPDLGKLVRFFLADWDGDFLRSNFLQLQPL